MVVERQLAELTARLRALEDREAIRNAIAGYGPKVDLCDSAAAADLWTEDGIYDVGGMGPSEGREAIRALFDGPVHQGLIAGGAAHVLSPVHIAITGDGAIATGYSCLFCRDGTGWRAERVAANRWTLRREGEEWRVTHRTNRLLDGSAEARAVLGLPQE